MHKQALSRIAEQVQQLEIDKAMLIEERDFLKHSNEMLVRGHALLRVERDRLLVENESLRKALED